MTDHHDPTEWVDDEPLEEISIDPSDPLAHLYADVGDVVDVDLPTRTTTLDDLERATSAPDEISERDVEELAVLVEEKIRAGTMTDEESAALGLGAFSAEGDFDLNAVGLKVVRRMAEREGLIPRGSASPAPG